MGSSFSRKASAFVTALACVAVTAHSAAAQAKSAGGSFGLGYTDVGVVVGLGGVGSASASFGGRFEHAFKAVPDMGNGILGFQVGADYYSWSGPGYSWKYIPIGATVNYHFKLDEPKFDPFVGLGLGYQVITCDAPGFPGDYCSNSAIYFIGRAGARYFFSPSMAAYGDVGAGGATLNLGIMFKLH